MLKSTMLPLLLASPVLTAAIRSIPLPAEVSASCPGGVSMVGCTNLDATYYYLSILNANAKSGALSGWNHTVDMPGTGSPCSFTTMQHNGNTVYAMPEDTFLRFYNVTTGLQVGAVPLSVTGFDPSGVVYDASSNLLYTIGDFEGGNFQSLAIDPTTGAVSVLQLDIGWEELGICQMTGSVSNKPYYYFLTTNETSGNGIVVGFDAKAKQQLGVYPYGAGIWSISTWKNSSTGSDRGLLVADSTGDSLVLVDLDFATGIFTTGNFMFDVNTMTAIAVMQGPDSLVTYTLAFFDMSSSPPKATYVPMAGSEKAQYGLSGPVCLP